MPQVSYLISFLKIRLRRSMLFTIKGYHRTHRAGLSLLMQSIQFSEHCVPGSVFALHRLYSAPSRGCGILSIPPPPPPATITVSFHPPLHLLVVTPGPWEPPHACNYSTVPHDYKHRQTGQYGAAKVDTTTIRFCLNVF